MAGDCGNALRWHADTSDPEIYALLHEHRRHVGTCGHSLPGDEFCHQLLGFDERLIQYLLVQYENALASASTSHNRESLSYLLFALRYARALQSRTAADYLDRNCARVRAAPPNTKPLVWESRIRRFFEIVADIDGRLTSRCS